jgi:hypothetical protein
MPDCWRRRVAPHRQSLTTFPLRQGHQTGQSLDVPSLDVLSREIAASTSAERLRQREPRRHEPRRRESGWYDPRRRESGWYEPRQCEPRRANLATTPAKAGSNRGTLITAMRIVTATLPTASRPPPGWVRPHCPAPCFLRSEKGDRATRPRGAPLPQTGQALEIRHNETRPGRAASGLPRPPPASH